MLRHGALLEFAKESDRPEIEALAGRTWELADFIVHGLGIKRWPGSLPGRFAFHRSCHSRGTDSGAATQQLLESIAGMELIPFGEGEQCCGFGGTFAINFPHTSREMGLLKLDHVFAAAPDFLISGDMGCLLHLRGLALRRELSLKARHVAQVLRDALRTGGLLPAETTAEGGA